MMMNRILPALVVLTLAGCTLFNNGSENPYEKPLFYEQFLVTGSTVDQRIKDTLSALRNNPRSPILHNQLGQLLVEKGFPKDAEREFERSVNADKNYYPAWYNLGLVRATHDDYSGAERAFRYAVRVRKGFSEALWQLGLIEEKRGNRTEAVELYAKALRHNHALLDVRTNPHLLDTKLVHLALIRNYDAEHARQAGAFQKTPSWYVEPQPEAASPEAQAKDIVTPAPPVTDPATQTPPPKPPGQ
jgi:tetratricopeptide (TPR) repeat protein